MTQATDTNLADLALLGGWTTADDIAIAVAIALAESGGKTDAVNHNANGTEDWGLWQINSTHGYNKETMLNHPGENAKAAHAIFLLQGWRAWTTYRSGAYLLFLPRGKAAAPTAHRDPDHPDSPGGSGTAPVTTVNLLAEALGALGHTVAWIVNPHNWLRVATTVVGGALVVGGLVVIARAAVPVIEGKG